MHFLIPDKEEIFVTGRCYIRDLRDNAVRILQKCDYDRSTLYAPICKNKGFKRIYYILYVKYLYLNSDSK